MPAHLCGCLARGISRAIERHLYFQPKHDKTHRPFGIYEPAQRLMQV
jgi:hypothetical protein